MIQVSFYHLSKTPVEKALPRLLEKVLDSGKRAVVLTSSESRIQPLSDAMWIYTPLGFLTHGTPKTGKAERQPIWVDCIDHNPNGASFIVLVDGAATTQTQGIERILEIFDGFDGEAVASARVKWKEYSSLGYETAYWRQNDKGAWEKA
jgi:DNA polymerase-3 subunit chi